MNKISIEDVLKLKDVIFVDTRSSKEFCLDNIPNSVNIPILDNEERKNVGTLYKKDQKKAFDLGVGHYNKKLPNMTKEIKKLDKNKKIIIYCWRGGMRSLAITNLVKELGFDAIQLIGGYKEYRAFIRDFLEDYRPDFRFIVLHGLTGCGKTKLIEKLPCSIDLENMAQHRSSIFGGIGKNPRTQKMFETLLFKRLSELNDESLVFIEGESIKVGKVYIPNSIFKAMNDGININITCKIENRVKRTVKDYSNHNEDEEIKKLIMSLKQELTKNVVDELLILMDDKKYDKVAKILLEKYYDARYNHGIDKLDYSYVVSSDSINGCVKELIKKKKELELSSK